MSSMVIKELKVQLKILLKPIDFMKNQQMWNILTFLLLTLLLVACKSFEYNNALFNQQMSSSLAKERLYADIVLQHFDSICAPKLLYKIKYRGNTSDKHYYILIKTKQKYLEYKVVVDSVYSLKSIDSIDGDKINKQFVDYGFFYRTKSDAEPIFKYDRYNTTYAMKGSTCKWCGSTYAYFVLKDQNGVVHGEFYGEELCAFEVGNMSLIFYIRNIYSVM